MTRRKSERLTIWLTPKTRAALVQRCRLDHLPMSRLVETLIRGHIVGRANKGKKGRYRLPQQPSGFKQPQLF